jgi:hypothetical protein
MLPSQVKKVEEGLYVALPYVVVTGIAPKSGAKNYLPVMQNKADACAILSTLSAVQTHFRPQFGKQWSLYERYIASCFNVLSPQGVNAVDHTVRSQLKPGQPPYPFSVEVISQLLILFASNALPAENITRPCSTCGISSCLGSCPYSVPKNFGSKAPVLSPSLSSLAVSNKNRDGRSISSSQFQFEKSGRKCKLWNSGYFCDFRTCDDEHACSSCGAFHRKKDCHSNANNRHYRDRSESPDSIRRNRHRSKSPKRHRSSKDGNSV